MVRPRAIRSPSTELAKIARAKTLDDVPDADIVDRARAGDSWAEEALFRKHFDYITALSFRLLRDRTEADDVVQDTFVDTLSQLRKISAPESLRSWLAGIAVHKVHRRFRRRRLKALLGVHRAAHDGALEASARAGTSPELRAELGLLDDALSGVADADRAAWMLKYVEGYALDEIASLCGCSLATVKRRIQRTHEVVEAHVELGATASGEGADDD